MIPVHLIQHSYTSNGQSLRLRRAGIGRMSLIGALASVLTSALVGGITYYAWLDSLFDRPVTPPAVRRLEPREWYERLQSEIRRLDTTRRLLDEQSKQSSIAYKLLRNGGFEEQSPACQEQLRLKQRLTSEIQRLDEARRRLRQYGAQLGDMLTETPRAIEPAAAEKLEQLLQAVDRYLEDRPRTSETESSTIPDYWWRGGADAFMDVNHQSVPADRRGAVRPRLESPKRTPG